MGVIVYWLVVAAVIFLGLCMPQTGRKKKNYIVVMAALHSFVCGFRYMYLHGDLRKYAWTYYQYAENKVSYFSASVFNSGRNAGFQWIMKFFSAATHGDFQILLVFIAVVTEIAVAILIFRYSPRPWISYLVWNCMGFYIAGFSLIKQALAMSVIMLASISIFEKKPIAFYLLTCLAGFIHFPAFIFLPAYWLGNRKINWTTITAYLAFAALIFVFRYNIMLAMTDVYYTDDLDYMFETARKTVGGRFFVIAFIALAGMLLKGFRERNFMLMFHMIVMAAIIQTFSVYDNVFSRLADYYLQFTVLFIPMIFYPSEQSEKVENVLPPVFRLTKQTKTVAVVAMVLILIEWYRYTNLEVSISAVQDNYTNFRFMWDVTTGSELYLYY